MWQSAKQDILFDCIINDSKRKENYGMELYGADFSGSNF